ncbi:MAG: glycoside hydrolase family 3 C-terminal domain-containing protein, partial [Bacteroidales bacterium]
PWNFSPVLDLGRNPSWSRMWETYGEDAYLVSEMGAASVLGYQGSDPNNVGQNHVAACLKHFMGYGAAISGKDRTPSMISEREMREKQFAPFLAAIRQGALSVMVNSGVNDGLPLHMNKELIQGWLKDDLKWDGLVVTDWNDINNLYTRDRIVATKKEAIELAINAGIDMSMVPYEWEFCNLLKELVNEKRVAMSRIDDAVKRVLRMKYRLNLFDKPYWSSSDYPLFGSEQHAEKAYESACEAITLLKNNDNVLPLNKKAKVLLTGPNANSMRTLNGGWSLSWQGEKVEQFAQQYNTILEALENKIGKENILFNEGVSYNHSGKYFEEIVGNYDQVLSDARKADYIVVCVGENSYCETPGNLDDLYLSDNQQNLIKVLAKANKPIILVLNEGRPRLISKVEPHAAGIVQTYLPGNYGGDALVDILFGDVNPSGKLPYTYPKYPNTLITYDHKPCESIGTMTGVYNYDAQSDVQYAFGYGLSYTKFEYSELTVDKTEFGSEDELNVSVKISNIGGRDGKEAALVFVSDLIASLTPDVRRLRGFDKVALKAGESKVVTFKIKASDLAFVNSDGKWILENGEYMVQIGNVSSLIKCVKGNIWENPNID